MSILYSLSFEIQESIVLDDRLNPGQISNS